MKFIKFDCLIRACCVTENKKGFLLLKLPTYLKEATNLDDLYEDEEVGSQHSVHWELEEVIRICKRLQKATLVSSFDQIMKRLVMNIYVIYIC